MGRLFVCLSVLPDTDSSSEDELSLCCMCRLLKAKAFPLGTASEGGRDVGKKEISVSLLLDLGLCMSTG